MRVEKSTEARNKQRLTPRRVLKAAWIFIPLILAAAMYFLLPMFPESRCRSPRSARCLPFRR